MINGISNIVYDTNYTGLINNGGYVVFDKSIKKSSKGGFFDFLEKFIQSIIGGKKKQNNSSSKALTQEQKQIEMTMQQNDPLKEQIKKLIEMPDEDYDDKKISSQMRQFIAQVEKNYTKTISDYKSHMAPSFREFKATYFNVSGIFGKSYYVHSYPSYIEALRTRDIFGMHSKWDMSFFVYPEDDSVIQSMLKTKATQLKAEINTALQKGITLDTEIEQQYKDVDMIRQKLTTREERYFETGMYMNIYNEDENKLKDESKKVEQKISGYGIKFKSANYRMDEGFNSTLPICIDELGIPRSSVTTSLAGSFPFIANDMIHDTGILYGINSHTGGLVIFDRFNSKLPNMNSVILATSGAGKSFTVKLEALRYLINGVDVIVIDPENEYGGLCKQVGGSYINVATSSQQFINPFDLPPKIEDIDYGKGDLLRGQIMNLIGIIELLVGNLSAEEEALLDKAIQSTYSLKGFSLDSNEYGNKQPPIMEDLLNVLEGMDGGDKIALRLSKYVSGTFGKLFNNYTNVDINNKMTVFSIRDLEEVLKTPAMFNVLNFIWTKVRSHKKKRLLICDEAWIMLQHETSANFLFGLVKRARKYGLGITTISQDIEDFVKSKYGKPIISNSGLQILLKQSTTSIKSLNDLLGLSEAEQQRLVAAGVGEGLMFAGTQHIGVKILASPSERLFISTDVK